MGLLEKIKNALFEVEYVEVEDKPKKEKKMKPKETEKAVEKPIAKKIVLPGRREDKVEEIQEEELKDEDFEIRPKDEQLKEVFRDNFNVMGDDDYTPPVEEPVKEEVAPQPIVDTTPIEPILATPEEPQPSVTLTHQDSEYADKDYVREYDSYKEKVHSSVRDDYRIKTRESRPYGMDPSYQVSIKEYGSENKDEKAYFRPSPIISPIYGILDKNYKKEDVVSKREIHITSSYARTNMSVDDIRNKAYGRRSTEEVAAEPVQQPKTIEPAFSVEEEDENLLVDLSDEKKPEVKEITVGDAMEYYHDLGLEYNVDYVDASSKNAPKKKPDDLEEDIKDTMNIPLPEEPTIERTEDISAETTPEELVEEKPMEVTETPVMEEKEESKEEKHEEESLEEENSSSDDDNLFDLIDSMYSDEDK